MPEAYAVTPLFLKLNVCERLRYTLAELAELDPGTLAHLVAYCVLRRQEEERLRG